MIKLNDTLRFDFNRIYVIESLGAKEKKTGLSLYNDLFRWKSIQIPMLRTEYLEVNSKKELYSKLDSINSEVLNDDTLPIIHFEIHGNLKGIVLNNGDGVTWDELATRLRKINKDSKHNLLITLATCYGAHFFGSIDPTKPSPCWGIIGPWDKTHEAEIEQSFFEFYEAFLVNGDINDAFKSFDKANSNGRNYKFYPAELVFEIAVDEYKKTNHSEENLNKRLEKLYIEAFAVGLVKEHQKDKWIASKKYTVLHDKSFFEKMKRIFLMK